MFKRVNLNPSGRLTDDCLVRAIAILFNESWEDAYWDLCVIGGMIHDMPNKDSVLSIFLRGKKYVREVISNECSDCYTIKDFCIDHPYGKYLVLTGTHAVAVIDGDYYDTSDSGNEIPMMYWRKAK